MTIHFVIGPPGSGKSSFIKQRFPGQECLDLRNFQEGLDPYGASQRDILRTYAKHRRAVINRARAGGADFVVEHTMLKAVRRAYYIRRLCDCLLVCWYTTHEGCFSGALKVYEVPALGEGFVAIYRITRGEQA